MRNHSAAHQGEKRAIAPCFDIERPALTDLVLLFAAREVAHLNGNTLRQQASIWRPFR